jgi:hypothetical protein
MSFLLHLKGEIAAEDNRELYASYLEEDVKNFLEQAPALRKKYFADMRDLAVFARAIYSNSRRASSLPVNLSEEDIRKSKIVERVLVAAHLADLRRLSNSVVSWKALRILRSICSVLFKCDDAAADQATYKLKFVHESHAAELIFGLLAENYLCATGDRVGSSIIGTQLKDGVFRPEFFRLSNSPSQLVSALSDMKTRLETFFYGPANEYPPLVEFEDEEDVSFVAAYTSSPLGNLVRKKMTAQNDYANLLAHYLQDDMSEKFLHPVEKIESLLTHSTLSKEQLRIFIGFKKQIALLEKNIDSSEQLDQAVDELDKIVNLITGNLERIGNLRPLRNTRSRFETVRVLLVDADFQALSRNTLRNYEIVSTSTNLASTLISFGLRPASFKATKRGISRTSGATPIRNKKVIVVIFSLDPDQPCILCNSASYYNENEILLTPRTGSAWFLRPITNHSEVVHFIDRVRAENIFCPDSDLELALRRTKLEFFRAELKNVDFDLPPPPQARRSNSPPPFSLMSARDLSFLEPVRETERYGPTKKHAQHRKK